MKRTLSIVICMIMLLGILPVSAALAEGNPFTDVSEDDYYYDAVIWAYENGITSGTGTGKFSPDKAITKAEDVQMIWAAWGRPEPMTTVNPFTDVKATAYYYKAVLWAVENGFIMPTSSTTFSPKAKFTWGQARDLFMSTVPTDPFTPPEFFWIIDDDETRTCSRADAITLIYIIYVASF